MQAEQTLSGHDEVVHSPEAGQQVAGVDRRAGAQTRPYPLWQLVLPVGNRRYSETDFGGLALRLGEIFEAALHRRGRMSTRDMEAIVAQLIYKPGQRRHLFAVRHLIPDPSDDECYVAGPLVGVYNSTSSSDVIRQVRRDRLVFPPYAVAHVTGYMLAMAHQGQAGFQVWIIEPGGKAREQYVVSLVDVVRAGWSVRKAR